MLYSAHTQVSENTTCNQTLFERPTPVRRITRIGYLVTSREMAIWPPKLGTLYILFSELFLWPKSGLFPKGLAHNTIEQ